MAWLRQSDAVVAEVTTPSLGVGYELGAAENIGKPVLCLYRTGPGRRLSAMIAGNAKLVTREYSTFEDASVIISEFLNMRASSCGR